ncbi:MAG TPA: PAS domain S-box protein, partial [Candidatus Eisenbacteria bacterium]|nr:PAS domain S-box protein [Candidatus Eisenbacteria bacterium]
MPTSIRVARDSFLAAVLAGTVAYLLGQRFLSHHILAAWLAGGCSVLGGVGTAAWLVHRRVARPLDALTVGFMSSPPRFPSPGFADIDEMHDLTAALDRLLAGIQGRMDESKEERRRLTQIMDAMPVGLLELDERGRIVFQNRMLRDLLGTNEGSIGRPPVEVIRSGELQELVDAVREERKPLSADVTLVKPVRRHLTVHARPLEHGLIVIIEDMTRIRQLERA